ncbi:efflux RND transporter periplasmic adaptor subunit [Enterovibrio sp. ZSDZ35]|uniref:Efflux RND transporter periplasmic adaptor subunit n=1 Tax=Enterovibrio qingdaonensis TaxID=2899818 RepID=A0ABT5QS49_9GAMM|nr:efflux RND transporter periplasmic adaptor subunit [Enterovibrio sp. ZSDZ35]MDD1783121.1 efflux RND transporter periplasmic adaptor subunit [Enterovibrio sp. ZSDZ35]
MKKKHLLALLPLMMGLNGCSDPAQTAKSEVLIRPVKTYVVSDQQSVRTASFPGIIQSNNLSEISFVSGGRVTDFPVRAAMDVKAGDVIAGLDQRELNNRLSQALSQYEIAEDEYQRLSKLSETGAVSKSSLQAKRVERDVAKVQLDSANEAIEDSVLLAPFDGVIAQTFIDKDQVVSGGQTVAILIGRGDLEAAIDVPGKLLASLYQNSLTGDSSTSFVSLDSDPEMQFPATFKEATLVADPTTQTYGLTFSFRTPTDVLVLPGMNVTVDIDENNSRQNDILVPIDAVSSDVNGTFVWLIDESSMTVTKKQIEVAEEIGDFLPVISGLNMGDQIVNAGVSQLSEGVAVREWKQD